MLCRASGMERRVTVSKCKRCDVGVLSDRMRMKARCPNSKCLNHPGSPVEAAHPKNPRGMRLTFEASYCEEDGLWYWSQIR